MTKKIKIPFYLDIWRYNKTHLLVYDMKNRICTIFLLLLILPVYSQEKNIILTGKVTTPQNRTIRLSIKEMFMQGAEGTRTIDNNGEFRFDYNQKYPHDNDLEYNDKMYRFIAAPNDSIHVEFNNGKIIFSGSNARLNNELQDLKIREVFFMISNAQKTLSPTDYKKRVREIHLETDSLLQNYYATHNSSIELRQWANTYYRYKMYDDLMRYTMFNEGKTLPNDYYDFLSETNLFPTELSNKDFVHTNSIISTFDSSAFISSITNDVVDNFSNLLRRKTASLIPDEKDLNKGYRQHIKVIVNETSGQMREIQLSLLFNQLVEWKKFEIIEDNLSTFYTYVKNKELRSYVMNAYDKSKDYQNSNYREQYLASFADDAILSPLVDSILTKNASKVIYLDVWSVWCGPCLAEMKYANSLKKKLEGKEVAFVYLCVDSKESEWKSKIKKFNISGDHYLLNKDQYNLLIQRFQIQSIPHYILIDKRGKIVPLPALSPSDGECITRIQELL